MLTVASRVSSPSFVGRVEPLARLEAALARAAAGEASATVVGGEAGVGKTRVVRELANRAPEFRVLGGTCIDLGDGAPPFGPLVEILRTLVRDDGASAVRAAAGPAAAELGRLVPELAPDEQFTGAEPVGATRVFEVAVSLFDRLARERPVLLIFEDLHWADQSTRDLVAYLIHNLGRTRVAIVATFRTDELSRRHPLRPFLAELDRRRSTERIDLERFDRDDVDAQLEGILGARPSAAVVDAVFARSEGNAFFTEELVAAGAELRPGALPPSLRDVLLVRLDALSDPTQALLRIAAAAGRTVRDELLAVIAQRDDAQLNDQLREAIAAQLIEPDGNSGYSFRHALVQEALYDDLLPGERVDLHGEYARVIAEQPKLAGGHRAKITSLLAYHWYAAQELGPALVASIDAGLEAERVTAFPEARRHYDRAVSLWSRAPGDRAGLPLDRPELLRKLADVESLLGDEARALQLIDVAIAEITADGNALRLSDLVVRRGRYLWRSADTGGALAAYAEALAICPPEPTPQRARTLSAYGQALMLVSRNDEAAAACREAIVVAQAIGDRDTDGHARNSLGTALCNLGEFEAGVALLEESLAIAREVDNSDDLMRAHANLAEALLLRGTLAEALRVAEAGATLARQLGLHRIYGSYLLATAAMISYHRGDWDHVDECTSTALALDAGSVAALRVNVVRAELLLARGDLDGAEHHVEPALALAKGADDVQHGAMVHGVHALVRAARGDVLEAIDAARRALEIANRTDDSFHAEPAVALAVELAADLAQAGRASRDDDAVARARDLAAPFIARADALACRDVMPRTRGELATITADRARLEGDDDAGLWRTAVATWQQIGEPYPEACARARLAEVLLTAAEPRVEAIAELRAAARTAETLRAAPLAERLARIARWGRIELAAGGAELDAAGLDAVEPDAGAGADRPFSLTPREREVLQLVADGCTNREIAGALFISAKTASVHVSNILAKLGVASRVEAGAVAHRLGLASS